VRRLVRRALDPFRTSRRERELSEEIESHFAMHMDDNMRAGMPRAQALREARLKFGSIDATKEEYRETANNSLLQNLLRDARRNPWSRAHSRIHRRCHPFASDGALEPIRRSSAS
jgi:hypothetical protein